MSASSLPGSTFPSHQSSHRGLAHKNAARCNSSAVAHANWEHILLSSPISPKIEKDFSAKELAQLFGKHVATIHRWFESVPGATLKKNPESVRCGKRRYWGLTVPQSVLIRFMDEHDIKIASNQEIS